MNGADVLRIVDAMHREKNIPKEIIFEGIEAALQLAAERAHGGGEDEPLDADEPRSHRHHRPHDRRDQGHQGRPGHRSRRTGPDRRPVGQAGHDPEDSRGRVQQRFRPNTNGSRANWSAAPFSGSTPARPSSPSTATSRSCRDPSKFPAKPSIPATRSRPSSSKSARPGSGSRSSSAATIRTSSAACSSRKSPRSPTTRSRSRRSPARPAIAPRSPSRRST